MKVYKAIAEVAAEISKTGISKDRRNEQQKYKFRGIDDIYNALAPLLAKHLLVILPRVLTRSVTERPSRQGGTLFSVVVEMEFDLISAEDGSKHTVKVFGEAMDSADKATNKAMSAAFKYMAVMGFCIPTEGDNDADATTHEPVVSQSPFPDEWPEPSKASMTPHVTKPKPQNLAPPGPNEKSLFDDTSLSTFSAVVDDMKQELEKYKIPFGKKYMGRTLLEIGIKNAKDYLAWLLKQSEMKGSQPPDNVVKLKEMIQVFEYYLLEQQNAKAVQQTPGFDPSEPWPEERR